MTMDTTEQMAKKEVLAKYTLARVHKEYPQATWEQAKTTLLALQKRVYEQAEEGAEPLTEEETALWEMLSQQQPMIQLITVAQKVGGPATLIPQQDAEAKTP